MTSRVQEQGSSLAAGTLTMESLGQRMAGVIKHVDIVSEGRGPCSELQEKSASSSQMHSEVRSTQHTRFKGVKRPNTRNETRQAHAAGMFRKAAADLHAEASALRILSGRCALEQLLCARW